MGGEDFAYYAERIPGCFIGLGIRNEAVGSIHSVHHPKFKVDEAACRSAPRCTSALALRSLEKLSGTRR